MKNQATHSKVQALIDFIKQQYFFILAFYCFAPAFAQDKITFRNGNLLEVKIMEISPDLIRYKNYDNLNGPMRVVFKSEVASIKYNNGEEEVYNTATSPLNTGIDSSLFMPEPVTKFGGPRFGLTYITLGTLASRLTDMGKNPLVTQFGWQFEQRMFNISQGPTGIVELVTLVGGMEQGLFLPSASLLVGLRGDGKKSYEFAIGPNLSLGGLGMVFAVGANFRSGKINFPVNLAYVPSVSKKQYNGEKGKDEIIQTGHRITLTVGFNLRKK